jgi:hypothetical protein
MEEQPPPMQHNVLRVVTRRGATLRSMVCRREMVLRVSTVSAIATMCVAIAACGSGGRSLAPLSRVAVPGAATHQGLSTSSSGAPSALTRGASHGPSAATVKALLGAKCRKGCSRLVVRFDACLLRNNVEMPYASGALLYDTKGIKTGSLRVREAVSECRSKLLSPSYG